MVLAMRRNFLDTELVAAFKKDVKSGNYSDTQALDGDDLFVALKYVKYASITVITGSAFGIIAATSMLKSLIGIYVFYLIICFLLYLALVYYMIIYRANWKLKFKY